MLTPEYSAGFFDGEGCVSFQIMYYKRKDGVRTRDLALRCMIGNTNYEILQAFKLTYGGSIHQKPVHLNPRAKDQWVWYAFHTVAVPFLRMIQPHIRVKASQVALALEFADWRSTPKEERFNRLPLTHGCWERKPETEAREAEFKARLHDLNRRGRIPA